MKEQRIEDYPDLIKKDGYIINNNNIEYNNARRRRDLLVNQKRKEKYYELRMEKIEETLDKILRFLNSKD